MKKIVFLVVIFTAFFGNSQTPTLYGTTSNSGLYGGGSIYKYDVATATKSVAFDFPIINNLEIYSASLCELNGKLYGTTSLEAGKYRNRTNTAQGLLFEYNPATNTHTVLYHFGDAITGEGGVNGGQPIGSLIPYNGKLYGVTAVGGAFSPSKIYGAGALFEFDPTTNSYTKLKDIDVNYGNANSPILLANDGSFYGVTKGNGFGVHPNGVVYKYDLTTNILSIVAGFPSGTTNLLQNCNSIRQAANGKIYGIAEGKVATLTNNVIFECDIVANTITQKASFGSTTLLQPINTVLYDGQNGSFYGNKYGSGGFIFKYNIALDIVTTEFTFNTTTGTPYIGAGINASTGKFYGHTISSSANPYGEIFEYNYISNTYSTPITYNATTDIYGVGSIFFASNNKAYSYCSYKPGFVIGTTLQELDFTTNTSTNKMEYNISDFGIKPTGNLLKGSDGKLYGTTTLGGSRNFGCFFSYDPTTNVMVNIQNFTSNMGTKPNEDMVEVAGKIYGTTYEGGANGIGTLFEYTIATNTYVVKKSFVSFPVTVGYNPVNGLIVGQNGKLYGQTKNGVMPSNTGIFEFDITTNSLNLVFAFATTANPFRGGFVEGAPGVFYGYYSRYLLKVDINTNTQTTLADFYATISGGNGSGRPLVANNAVYCLLDADSCYGILKHDIATATNTSSSCAGLATGPGLYGGIIKASDDKLYFNTNTYQKNSVIGHRVARVFELNPTTLATTSLCTLEASMGHYPLGLLTEANAAPLSNNAMFFANNLKIYPNPTSGDFSIEIDEELTGSNVLVYNLLGQVVKNFTLENLQTNENLNKGIYLLEIEKNNKKVIKKLIVN